MIQRLTKVGALKVDDIKKIREGSEREEEGREARKSSSDGSLTIFGPPATRFG